MGSKVVGAKSVWCNRASCVAQYYADGRRSRNYFNSFSSLADFGEKYVYFM